MTHLLDGAQARQLLGAAGVRFAPWEVVDNRAAALAAAQRLGAAVALKSAAADVVHKSDLGCVALGLQGDAVVGAAYDRIVANAARAGSTTSGRVMVERMTAGIAEVLIGVKQDAVFGPMLLVGLGGIWVEVLGDVAMRLCPVSESEAHAMFGELRGAALLTGGRGRPAADVAALAGIACVVSRLAVDTPGLLELDLNPVMALREGALAVDARIVLAGGIEGGTNP